MRFFIDNLHRIAYATDASAYREIPKGVAFPASREDVVSLIAEARRLHTHLIPRAGGTSIAGQVVGSGIVVDVNKNLNHILEINAEERWARVEPGVVRDELNLALQPYGLFFSPETSTSNRCCIGGMVGNNSCGTHSLVYGSTRHHVLQLRGVLSDGSFFDTDNIDSENPLLNRIISQLKAWQQDEQLKKTIEDNYPDKSLQRRSCGYAIDEAIDDNQIDLCKLICGSEGTLCFITEIKVSLDPLPPTAHMVLCVHCDSLEASFEANLVALKHNPVAVELMDDQILELCKQNPSALKNSFFVKGNPAALLIAEFNGENMEADASALEKELSKKQMTSVCTRVYGNDVSRVWALRKVGLGVLSGMKGDAKPIGVIEDTAVAPHRLPAYMKDFRALMDRLGLNCVYYGHISTGELHLRPILNIKTESGRSLFRKAAEESALLVKKHKGSLSGEHGDGRLRGEFIPLMYGEECYQLMRQVKQCWDPDGVFNMGKIVDTPPMDEWLRFETNQAYAVEKIISSDKTYYNWKAAFDECHVEGATGARSQVHALMCSIEQCNGAGDCRKSNLIGGTMCPAFKVSHDELMATRARSNVLREILTNGLSALSEDDKKDKNPLTLPELKEVLYSCLTCKGCQSECPSNVDITRIRAEVLQHIYDYEGTPFRTFAVARMAMVERLGHMVRPLYNLMASWNLSSNIIKRIVKFSTERDIPTLSRRSMRALVRIEQKKQTQGNNNKGKVLLFADEFTNYQEAELGLTFAKLLIALGYAVEVPKHVESGRAPISKGCLKLAKKFVKKNVELLSPLVSDDVPLVGIEPSCILSFRDEYPDLVQPNMREKAINLGRNCLLYDEFIIREVAKGNISAADFKEDRLEIWLHGHCHQKTMVGVEKTVAALRLLKGAKVHVIPSSCCGMAGSFGYEKEHYKTSIAIGEMVLFPAVRKSQEHNMKDGIPAIVAAPGVSCRQQILDGTGVHAVHPIEIMYKWLQ